VRWFQDPGQAGVYQTNQLRSSLPGFDADGVTCQLSKSNRAQPASRAAEFGEIMMLSDPSWNQGFLNELSQFPDAAHDDQVDALAGAYNYLSGIYDRKFSQSTLRQS
jgi:predicted phage terminase large subunit-like protein